MIVFLSHLFFLIISPGGGTPFRHVAFMIATRGYKFFWRAHALMRTCDTWLFGSHTRETLDRKVGLWSRQGQERKQKHNICKRKIFKIATF